MSTLRSRRPAGMSNSRAIVRPVIGHRHLLCRIYLCVLCCVYVFCLRSSGNDYYELLGVSKDAGNREIRQAFKKLALVLHPDRNKNDPKASEEFIRLNQAYEVLKDEDLRKKYDLHGEEGLKENSNQGRFYKSWDYYHDNFGLYDDDPEITTLSRSDFARFVTETSDFWFVNYYSPRCSHCHHLAPVWRELARKLEDVVRFGAVNCEEDWLLCREQGVHAYPTLLLYPKQEKYKGDRTLNHLLEFISSRLPVKLISLTAHDVDVLVSGISSTELPWLIFACDYNTDLDCPNENIQLNVALILVDIVNVAHTECNILRQRLQFQFECGAIFYETTSHVALKSGKLIKGADSKEFVQLILQSLPAERLLASQEMESIEKKLSASLDFAWLIHFVQEQSKEDLEFHKLPALMRKINTGLIDCAQQTSICNKYHINKFPSFVILKPGGGHEVYHGRMMARDVASFAEEASTTTVVALGPEDFHDLVISQDKKPWFVDFYAPWCPPCMQLLPEWRKASRSIGAAVKFGTVDCTIHQALCSKYNIRSYPTTIFYNQTVAHHYQGVGNSENLVDFVKDMLSPVVVSLTSETFSYLVDDKSADVMWLVDFFAPWCGPCQQLSPHWRKMAKMLAEVPGVLVGQVDCTLHSLLCDHQGISSYPSIRMYPFGVHGSKNYMVYNGWDRDASSLRAWVFRYLPSTVIEIDNNDFYNDIIYNSQQWIVDFYSPWCGHCHAFEPDFEIVSQKLKGRVKAGKINCEKWHYVCSQAGIRAYPTVKFYEGAPNPHTAQSTLGIQITSHTIDGIIVAVESHLVQSQRKGGHDEL